MYIYIYIYVYIYIMINNMYLIIYNIYFTIYHWIYYSLNTYNKKDSLNKQSAYPKKQLLLKLKIECSY